MEIKINNQTKNFEIENYIFRKMHGVLKDDRIHEVDHFQAQFIDKRFKSRDVNCVITYLDDKGSFLGFDEQYLWCGAGQEKYSITLPVNIPKDTTQVFISVTANKNSKFFRALFCATATIALITYLIWSL